MTKCPECNAEIADEANACPECGYPLNASQSKKSGTKRIAIVSLLIIVVVGIAFSCFSYAKYKRELPLKESMKYFTMAQDSEQNYNYEDAMTYYDKVIPEDSINYENARERIAELRYSVKVNKFAARCCIAASNKNVAASLKDMSDIETVPDSNFSFKAGGIGYIISPHDNRADGKFSTSEFDSESDLFVTTYKAVPVYNGILTYTENEINQMTSDLNWDIDRSIASGSKKGIDEKVVQHYLDLYHESKDLDVLR